MSNKTQLQTNNTNLASYTDRVTALITKASSLPDAGSGSGSEDLETELTTQENLISQLSTILDSKASGGSGSSEVNMDTCNIMFVSDYPSGTCVFYETVRTNKIEYEFRMCSSSASDTGNMRKVRCGSIVGIEQSGFDSVTITDGEIIQQTTGEGLVYRAPNTPNANIVVTITTD